ncbi:MAG: hypothetical protein ACFFD4_10010 [Candidatus Odinarchaeota archaeon]
MQQRQRQFDILKDKKVYVGAIFSIFFFFLLHGVSREFPADKSPDFTVPLLEFAVVVLIYLTVLAFLLIIWFHYIRNENDRWKKRRLKFFVFGTVLFLIVANFLYILENPPGEINNGDNNQTSTVDTTTSAIGTSDTQPGSSGPTSSGPLVPGTAKPAPEVISPLDPRLVIVVFALFLAGLYFFRKSKFFSEEEKPAILDDELQMGSEQFNRKKSIIKQYLTASNDLELFGADNALELTTLEFENDVKKKLGTKNPDVSVNLETLSRIYEEAKFSTHEITDSHIKSANKTANNITNLLFHEKEEQDSNHPDSGNKGKKNKFTNNSEE